MTHYISRFPDGAPGTGLLVLRLGLASVALGVAVAPYASLMGLPLYPAAIGASLALLIGLATRTVAALTGVMVVAGMPVSGQTWMLAGHLAACVAITLLGPGAYSLDARIHYRRVIHLHTKRLERGDEE